MAHLTSARDSVLTINGGSSSIKFAVYPPEAPLKPSLSGELDRIGSDETTLSWRTTDGKQTEQRLSARDHRTSMRVLIDWLEAQDIFESIGAIGHRVVHGLAHTAPTRITPNVLAELHQAAPYAPDHLPHEIEMIDALRARRPHLMQVACFDTAFHHAMPRVAKLLPIPRRYFDKGVQRYGFHGLSYQYMVEELGRIAGPDAAHGRVILAHLGGGSSLAAVYRGASIDTSMAFTPSSGLVMSTRSGDLDPGVGSFLAHAEQMTASQFHQMVNHESGLLGVSETSSDMRQLLGREAADMRAAEAVALFCYSAKKWIGAFAAALGGLDTLVFTAGIGERSAAVRARICDDLGFLGIKLHDAHNAANAAVISADESRITVRVIRTDEQLVIARSVFAIVAEDTQRNMT